MDKNWIDNLIPEQSLIRKGDVIYTYMGKDEFENYKLYSVPYSLTRYQLEVWCKLYKI